MLAPRCFSSQHPLFFLSTPQRTPACWVSLDLPICTRLCLWMILKFLLVLVHARTGSIFATSCRSRWGSSCTAVVTTLVISSSSGKLILHSVLMSCWRATSAFHKWRKTYRSSILARYVVNLQRRLAASATWSLPRSVHSTENSQVQTLTILFWCVCVCCLILQFQFERGGLLDDVSSWLFSTLGLSLISLRGMFFQWSPGGTSGAHTPSPGWLFQNCNNTGSNSYCFLFVRISCHLSFLYVAHQIRCTTIAVFLLLSLSACCFFVFVATVPHHTHAWVEGGVTR